MRPNVPNAGNPEFAGVSRQVLLRLPHERRYNAQLGREALETETRAAEGYRSILDLPDLDSELHDAVEQIYFQEERSVEELTQLLDSE